MIPQLQASAASGLGGTGGDIQVNITIPNLGRYGLVVIGWVGAETGGETNPEEINVTYFNGQYADGYIEANTNETGGGFSYFYGSKIPAAGTYLCGANFQDSPKQAERKRIVVAAFSNVKSQVPEITQTATGSGSPRSLSITPLTSSALVIASWSWRTGFAQTWGWGTEIVTSRGDNSSGVSFAYAVIETPAAQSVSISATNPEDNGLAAGAFAMQSTPAGQIL